MLTMHVYASAIKCGAGIFLILYTFTRFYNVSRPSYQYIEFSGYIKMGSTMEWGSDSNVENDRCDVMVG